MSSLEIRNLLEISSPVSRLQSSISGTSPLVSSHFPQTIPFNLYFPEEEGVEVAKPASPDSLDYPAHLLEVDIPDLQTKLTSRVMSIGSSELVNKTLNVEQADATRDALAKAIYYRLFEFLVKV